LSVEAEDTAAAAGPSTYAIECKLDSDLRRVLAATVVSQNWGLLEMRGVSMSLEDVFINLITKE
jgi:ABC-2 type transport system ATP-binding protein